MDSITGSGKTFQVQYNSPTFEFAGYPAGFIAPVSSPNKFKTTNENERIYTFRHWSFVEFDQTASDASYNMLMDCMDEVINKIDHEENPEQASRTMGNSLPTGYTLLAVMAAPGEIIPDAELKVLAGQVTIECKVLVDITLLT